MAIEKIFEIHFLAFLGLEWGSSLFPRVELNRSQPKQYVDTSHILFQPLFVMKSPNKRVPDGIFLAFNSESDREYPGRL